VIRRGSAALILVVIVLGFMMAISTSYVTMIQTETRVQTSLDKNSRAKDAAFAGVSYVIARLLATSSTMLVDSNPVNLKRDRLYFAFDDSNSGKLARFGGLDASPETAFQNIASSQWLYPVTTGLLESDEMASSVAFFVTSYPATDSTKVIPEYYYVKSQGMFRDIEPDGTVTATYTAQILARLFIATPTLQVKLERYQYMEVETDIFNSYYFLSRQYIYP